MPYWRLSGFYFFYFATLGVLVPYWGLYLQSVCFTPVDFRNRGQVKQAHLPADDKRHTFG